ncbi:hypothetical protein VQ056_18550 [Paenibacillus sp. JTLBN-2024]
MRRSGWFEADRSDAADGCRLARYGVRRRTRPVGSSCLRKREAAASSEAAPFPADRAEAKGDAGAIGAGSR